MGKFMVPMFRYSVSPYVHGTRRPQRRYNNPHPVDVYQPSFGLMDILLNGILGQLRTEQATKNHGIEADKQTKRPWIFRVSLKGFQPEDINVKVVDHVVHITAKHIEETKMGRNTIERYRKVELPEDVDDRNLNCFSDDNGKLILTAPFKSHCVDNGSKLDTNKAASEDKNMCKLAMDVEANQTEEETAKKYNPTQQPDLMNVPIEQNDNEKVIENNHISKPVKDIDEKGVAKIEEAAETDQTNDTSSAFNDENSESNADDQIKEREMDENSTENSVSNADDQINEGEMDGNSTEIIDGVTNCTAVMQVDGENTMQSTENIIDIKEIDSVQTLPVHDTTRIVTVDGTEQYEISINLHQFKPEQTIIRWKSNALRVEAEKEMKTDTVSMFQKVHREYTIPLQSAMDKAQASMDKDGLLRVTIPLDKKSKTSILFSD